MDIEWALSLWYLLCQRPVLGAGHPEVSKTNKIPALAELPLELTSILNKTPHACHFTLEQRHWKDALSEIRAIVSKGVCSFHSEQHGQIDLRRSVPIFTPTNEAQECFRPHTGCIRLLGFCQSDRWEMISLCTFNLLFSYFKRGWTSFYMFMSYSYFLFFELCARIPWPFFYWH